MPDDLAARTPNFDVAIPSIKGEVSPEEWKARVDLAACYRLIDLYGMSDLIANHVSVRVPGEPGHFLINAYGLLYEEMTASSLIKIDLDGNVIAKPPFDYGVNRAGFVIHAAIHRARHDALCVIHTHTAAGMAVSSLECGLMPMNQTAMRFAHCAYHDYEGVVLNLEEQERLVADLGQCDLMILRNHGLLGGGPDHRAGVQPHPPRRAFLPHPADGDGRGRRAGDAADAGDRSDLPGLPAQRAPSVRRARLAGAAAQARPPGPELQDLSAGLARQRRSRRRP